jgi:hypothetical protein
MVSPVASRTSSARIAWHPSGLRPGVAPGTMHDIMMTPAGRSCRACCQDDIRPGAGQPRKRPARSSARPASDTDRVACRRRVGHPLIGVALVLLGSALTGVGPPIGAGHPPEGRMRRA